MKMRRHIVPLVLIACAALILFWEAMARLSERPFSPFAMTRETFRDFSPQSPDWSFTAIRSEDDDRTAPNLVSYMAASPRGGQVVVRLVHGYNMPMCMKIKGYTVELLEDGSARRTDQLWRLTSETGDAAVWVTAMLRAGDFARADVDIRSMAFPRIASRDDPSWVPRGISFESLKHPVESIRVLFRAKWNNSRCDLPTFLKLRQPAWADETVLSLVAYSYGVSVPRGGEAAAAARIRAARDAVLDGLIAWRLSHPQEE